MKRIKEYWFIILYGLFAFLALIINPLSGGEITSLPWRVVAYIFMLLLVEEGMRKEKLLLPLMRVLNSIRETPFLFLVLLLSSFVLSLFLFDFMVILILLPFTIKLLKESNKAQYTASVVALMTLSTVIGGIISPFSPAGLMMLFESEKGFFTLLLSLLPQFLISLFIFIVESLVVLRKAKGDKIYLHIEKEDYWDSGRKGIRILYLAFFLVLVFGVNFNTIDLLLVTLIAFLILEREVYKRINYPVFITILLIMVTGSALKDTLPPLILSFLLTRFGALTALGVSESSIVSVLPGALLSLSFAFIYTLRELKEERRAYATNYALLALPHFIVYLIFALI